MSKRILFTFIFTLIVTVSGNTFFCQITAGRPDQRDLYELAEQANASFRQATGRLAADPAASFEMFDRSIMCFNRIIADGGISNGYLHYNIGNAYLLKGDLGRAILHYRRAERLGGPADDIDRNLAFARAKRLDAIPKKAEKRIMETLFFWHYDLGVFGRFLFAMVFLAIAFVSAGAAGWLRPKKPLVWLSVISFIGAICFGLSTGISAHSSAGRSEGVIVAAEVTARQGDGLAYAVSFKEPLHAGSEFEILTRRGGWLSVRLANGEKTWIPKDAAEEI